MYVLWIHDEVFDHLESKGSGHEILMKTDESPAKDSHDDGFRRKRRCESYGTWDPFLKESQICIACGYDAVLKEIPD